MNTDGLQEQAPGTPNSERPRSFFGRNSASHAAGGDPGDAEELEEEKRIPTKWSMGVLNDQHTHEVPGSVLLLTGDHNQPLGLRNAPARNSASSLPAQPGQPGRPLSHQTRSPSGKKTTPDGAIILDPQPEDSHNDPLNWPSWRRDTSLLSLGLYCMVGGGMTPILAAGFTNVASTYDVSVPKVALTTGLYMMGLGVGSVFASPTAILFGKRPVYLVSAIIFIVASVWCAVSPSYNSLLLARIFQGVSLSPVECLPSATIAEIFFLHERAYRIGIYTLLLLGGKNLVPLVSAATIQSLNWRWVFWIVAMVGGFCGCLLFLFVPETFWDRTPHPKSRKHSKLSALNASRFSILFTGRRTSQTHTRPQVDGNEDDDKEDNNSRKDTPKIVLPKRPSVVYRPTSTNTRSLHVDFAPSAEDKDLEKQTGDNTPTTPELDLVTLSPLRTPAAEKPRLSFQDPTPSRPFVAGHEFQDRVQQNGEVPPTPELNTFNSPSYRSAAERPSTEVIHNAMQDSMKPPEEDTLFPAYEKPHASLKYTNKLRDRPELTFIQQLKPFNGRISNDNWLKVAIRPFILFAYPAVLWSAIVYACAVGWLIVLSESVAVVYRTRDTYNFSALSTGLIYISPFIGGILGTAVAGKVSDIIVRAMSSRNGGLYEPEFRLVMAGPVAVTTVIGLMGFGWSAQIHDSWIVPTIFFGIISFGCSLGSTTAITFCVDSYRQYAGEALVTLNFSKNIFHGLVFSLFFTKWLEEDGSRKVFIWLGVIQLILMAATVPMYIFGKRARMWTVRMNLMEKF